MSMIRAGRDRQSIDVDDPDDCRFWCEQFGIQPEQLKEAVREAGNRSDDVREYVERHFVVPVRWHTTERGGFPA